jgi:hypothetical protein
MVAPSAGRCDKGASLAGLQTRDLDDVACGPVLHRSREQCGNALAVGHVGAIARANKCFMSCPS